MKIASLRVDRTAGLLRTGVTMIELIVVIVIVGLIAGLAAVNLRSPIQRAAFQSAKQSVLKIDSLERESVRRTHLTGNLDFDYDRNVITGRRSGRSVHLPKSLQIDSVTPLWNAMSAQGASVESLKVSLAGHTQSYRVRFIPSGNRRNDVVMDVSIIGFTGEAIIDGGP